MDPAVRYSVQCLDALRDCLKLENDDGQIEFDPGRINTFSIQRLHRAFDDLDWGTFPRAAIDELGSYGRDNVQTTAVGPAPSLDLLVKLGWLLGARVVLWDNVIRGSAYPDEQGRINLQVLGSVALDFLKLEAAVAIGAVVILPHPSRWSERYMYYARPLDDIPGVPLTVHGLLNARALLDDGVPLHPYMWATSDSVAPLVAAFEGGPALTRERAVWHRSVQRLITHQHFGFIEDLRPERFYWAFERARKEHPELHEAIRDRTWPDKDGTEQEEERRWMTLAQEIQQQLPKRDAAVLREVQKYAADTGLTGAVCSAVGGVLGLAPRGEVGDAILGALAGFLGLAPAVLNFISSRWSTPVTGAVYQLFHELSLEDRREYFEGPGLRTAGWAE